MKRSRKVTRIIVVVLAIAIMIGAVVAMSLMNREQELEKIQNEALIELEKKRGEYDESSIVLYETSPVEARQLAEKLGATLRISKDGRFAALALPEGTTILDVYADDANREYIEKMSADYSVRVAELTDAEEEEDSGRLPIRPNYNVSDTLYSSQSYLDYINVGNAWSKSDHTRSVHLRSNNTRNRGSVSLLVFDQRPIVFSVLKKIVLDNLVLGRII